MNIAEKVIRAFGGPQKASEALGVPYTTVDSWKRSGRIPKWRRSEVLKAADNVNVELPREYVEAA